MKFHKKLSAISLGQGQGPRAEALMRQAQDRGRWVFFQNCHLAPSWMPSLERLIEQIDGDKVRQLEARRIHICLAHDDIIPVISTAHWKVLRS